MTTSRREEQSAKDAIRTANEYAQFTVALVAEVRRRWPEMTERMRKGVRDFLQPGGGRARRRRQRRHPAR